MLDAPFLGSEALAAGLLTRRQLYGPRYRRMLPGVFAPVDLRADLLTRSRAAYLLVRDRGGALAGYSAAVLLGADSAPRSASAEVVVPTQIRARRGLLVHRVGLAGADLAVVGGCRVTSRVRTGWDLARRLPLVEAVVAVDALSRTGRPGSDGEPAPGGNLAPVDLLARRDESPGARGGRRLAEVIGLTDARAGSPPETRLRLALVRAGLPRPEVQYPIMDEYGFPLARVDLAYPDATLAIEYDGERHYTRSQGELDRQRDAELAAHGWQTFRVGRDGMDMPRQTARQVEDLRRDRLRRRV